MSGGWLFQGCAWRPLALPSARSDDIAIRRIGSLRTPWLHLRIQDSAVATLRYAPCLKGSGVAYLGLSPRAYFGPTSPAPTVDRDREAAAIAAWVAGTNGSQGSRPDRPADLASVVWDFLAPDELPDWDNEDADQVPDEDIFVEFKVLRFLAAVGLPRPTGLVEPRLPGVSHLAAWAPLVSDSGTHG